MSGGAPLASVIVPTFERVGPVVEALDSVFAQTFEDFEVLVVDDGSTDGTRDVVEARYRGESRLRFFRKANGGVSSARNLGLDHARGRYVALLDSDDLYEPEHLARQIECLDASPEAAVAICDARYVGAWRPGWHTIFGRSSFRPPVNLDAILDGAWALPSCVMFRRDAAPDVRYDESLRIVEDVEFMACLYATGLHGVLNRGVLTSYRKLGEQITDDELGIQKGILRVLERYAEHSGHPHRHAVQLARRRARVLMAQGRWAEARPHLKAWLKGRPGLRPLRYLLASYRRAPSD